MKGIEIQLVEQKEGIFLPSTHTNWIWNNKQSIIALPKDIQIYCNLPLYLCDKYFTYGVIKLHSPYTVNKKRFEELSDLHLVNKKESKNWSEYYIYDFDWISQFEKPRHIMINNDERTIQPVDFLFNRECELFNNIKNYNVDILPSNVLQDDWRIMCAWFGTAKRKEHFKYSLEDVINIGTKIYEKLVSRDQEVFMENTDDAKELFELVSDEAKINKEVPEKKNRKIKMTPEKIEELKKYTKKGLSRSDIAERLGVGKTAVYLHQKKLKLI